MGERHDFARKLIWCHLKKHYKKHGCDFFFKSRKLKVGLNNSLIGRVCLSLVNEGKLILWNGHTAQHDRVYLTNFKNMEGDVFG